MRNYRLRDQLFDLDFKPKLKRLCNVEFINWIKISKYNPANFSGVLEERLAEKAAVKKHIKATHLFQNTMNNLPDWYMYSSVYYYNIIGTFEREYKALNILDFQGLHMIREPYNSALPKGKIYQTPVIPFSTKSPNTKPTNNKLKCFLSSIDDSKTIRHCSHHGLYKCLDDYSKDWRQKYDTF